MHACDVIRRLHAHRMWANAKLLRAVRSLSVDELQQHFNVGQGSVWHTLTHLMAAEHVWLEALFGDEDALLPGDVRGKLPGNQQGEGAMQSVEELAARWEQIDTRWRDYLDQLTDAVLDETVYKVSTSSGAGKRHGTTRADILLHVCTHAQYTTAQLVNMLRHLGMSDLPDVMLISLAREEAGGR